MECLLNAVLWRTDPMTVADFPAR